MTQKPTSNVNLDYYKVDQNQNLVMKLFQSYYRAHINSGKMFDDIPDFFMVRPEVCKGADFVTRSSDKLILEDCIQRAAQRQGYVTVSKRHNPKLKYYWLELEVAPFVLGDRVNENNKSEFFYLLSQFIDYTKSHPNIYGDLTAEIDSDKDLALMLKEINSLGDHMRTLRPMYSDHMLVSFNPNWPVTEVNKLMMALKDNDQSWCDVFFESLLYVMGRKAKGN